jgi:hypothetical protein
MHIPRSLLAAGTALALATTLHAAEKSRGGLRTNYAKIVLENLPIGHAISMTKLANLPLVVGNNFDTPVSISISPRAPTALRPGYEAIPDATWVQLETTTVQVGPGEERAIDVLLHLPNDHYLYGRRFQVDIAVSSSRDSDGGGVTFAYELTGSLLFSIAPVANDDAFRMAQAAPLNAAYKLSPPRVDVYNVTPGAKINITDANGEPVTLTNGSDLPQRFLLQSIDPATTAYTPDPGSRFVGAATDVAIAASQLDIGPGESKPLFITVQVPEVVSLKEGPLVYLVAVRSGTHQTVEQYVKVYLWAGARPPKQELGSL